LPEIFFWVVWDKEKLFYKVKLINFKTINWAIIIMLNDDGWVLSLENVSVGNQEKKPL
jgi:hypothetical protein